MRVEIIASRDVFPLGTNFRFLLHKWFHLGIAKSSFGAYSFSHKRLVFIQYSRLKPVPHYYIC